MDGTAQYCAMRRDLEEQGWFLTGRLAELTDRLMRLIGRDHGAFLTMKQECRETRVEINISQRRLRDHREVHGC